MPTTNYTDTFILVAEDSTADHGIEPPERGGQPTIAARIYRLIAEHPYQLTSDDVIFTVWADRNGIADGDRPAARVRFFSKGQACLRASDLGKKYGWGIHHDAEGCVALYGVETEEYRRFSSGNAVTESGAPTVLTKAMRSSRA